MQKITARDILGSSLVDIWKLPKQNYSVTYDDSEVHVVRQKFIIFDRYIWELFLLYPQTPIVYSCTTADVVGDGYFNGDTHMRLFERVFKHIVSVNNLKTFALKEALLKRIYGIIDLIQNDLLTHASPDLFTISAMDFVNFIKDPKLKVIHDNMAPTPEGVESAYKQIRGFITTYNGNNRFVNAYRSKAVNDNQSNQCIGPRGFATDLDRTVFRQPVTSGFIKGMSSLYEIMVESCTAAKSLNATGTHIQQSEYTSRRIQILSMIVSGVVEGDCGSTEFLPITVTEQNLETLKGKHYLLQDGTLGSITADSKELVGTIAMLRSVLYCKHHDSTKVCMTCLGEVGGNFPTNTNLGYTVTAHLMEKITQAILSTKHLTHSVRKSFVKLEGLATKYFYSNDNGDLFFRNDIDLTGLSLMLPNSKVSKLVDVLSLLHTNIGLSKIGELDIVYIKNLKPKTPVSETLNISYKDRPSVLTRYLLEYIKASQHESDARGNFIIPLDDIDKKQPIFNNPLKEANIINFVNRISSTIETNVGKITDPVKKLDTLLNTTLENFKCNLFVLEILVYATTTFNSLDNNYRLGRGSPDPRTEGKVKIFRNRDFAALASFEKQMEELRSYPVTAFSNLHKQDHPMAVFFTPKEVAAKDI